MNEHLCYSSIGELHKLLRTRELSPVAVVDACLERIERLNPTLNAFITVLADQAREQAYAAQAEMRAGHWRGPLHGIPVGVKDFYDTANVRTTAAFEQFKDRIPQKDAVSVARLRQAGAIVIGKMNMHRLGMGTTGLESHFGPAVNPWNDQYIPGGSSSGSAAAVGAGLCYATLDTDAIGSCRLPAACCGVVGFKGTYGLVSAEGILEGEPADEAILWLSHPAVTTRTAEDTALVLDGLAERHVEGKPSHFYDEALGEGPIRVGVANNFKSDAEIRSAFMTAVETVGALGHEIVSVAAPVDIPRFGDVHTIEADRRAVSARTFGDVDVLLMPTTTTTVLTVKNARANPQALSAENTMFANYFGLPAVSIPCGFDTHGLPIGLQIVGKPWDDGTVLRLARQYQGTTERSRAQPIP
jgi:aspartyl-tRNA(Asn)/glutamyl-tRNA(Gln) amidotransferase subunit A